MKSHARVAVIGSGVVGCSVLYHLTRFGWADVMLIERSDLTSGSTWHAAGGMHTINVDPNVAELQKYSVELYREIEARSSQDISLHMTGGVMLAATPERFDWLKSILAKGHYMGLDAQLVTPNEAHELMPLLDPDQFVGGLYDEVEGHLDPYGTTHAYAKSARRNGAEIALHTKVESLTRRPDGSWCVTTDKGEVIAEHVVNAAGLWAREVGRVVGLELPVLAMEHMYLLTDDMPEVAAFNEATGREMLHAVDFDGEIYLRQERKGMLMGTYEKACKPWAPKQTPWDFGHQLLDPDLDRIAPSLEVGFRHFPAFETAGIKQIINGPFTFAPDGNPLVGPVRGLPGYWCACAGHGRVQPGRRCGACAGHLDHRGRSGPRCLRQGHRTVRSLRHPRLYPRESARELRPPLFDPVSERGIGCRAPAADDPDLRHVEDRRCAVRGQLRAGTTPVVCARGGQGCL